MISKPAPKSRKVDSTLNAKLLLATFSVVSTIGLWSLFSRSVQDTDASQPDEASNVQTADSSFLASLPPLPTVVPISMQVLPTTVAVLSVPTPQVQPGAPVKILLGGAQPGTVAAQTAGSNPRGSGKRGATTTTRSSK